MAGDPDDAWKLLVERGSFIRELHPLSFMGVNWPVRQLGVPALGVPWEQQLGWLEPL